ncbi:MAG: serine/threonine protein kinase [Chloroflexi bacterium]|nr:serine/threonine protein kinase [Chloroflexota bacterium]
MAGNFLTLEEVLQELRIDEGEVKALVAQGKLRRLLDGRIFKFRKDEVAKLKKMAETDTTLTSHRRRERPQDDKNESQPETIIVPPGAEEKSDSDIASVGPAKKQEKGESDQDIHNAVFDEDETSKMDVQLAEGGPVWRPPLRQSYSFSERYQDLGTIAVGGMAEVHRVLDRMMEREVALKIPRPEKRGDQLVQEQFYKEAKISARFMHPNLIPVFDVGFTDEGVIYYTMRLVKGRPLDEAIEEIREASATPLLAYPVAGIVQLVARIAETVQYAHDMGVIHLDLKPQNVLLSDKREAFVIDWGLAMLKETPENPSRFAGLYKRRRESDVVDEEPTTYAFPVGAERTGETSIQIGFGVFAGTVGTPSFMAPEQFAGAYEKYSEATDVYGLGGILYYCLTGRPANLAETPAGFRIVSETGSRPSLADLNLDADDQIAAIVQRALSPKPEDRYPDARAMALDLRKWLRDQGRLAQGSGWHAQAMDLGQPDLWESFQLDVSSRVGRPKIRYGLVTLLKLFDFLGFRGRGQGQSTTHRRITGSSS